MPRMLCLLYFSAYTFVVHGENLLQEGHASCLSPSLVMYTAVFTTNWTRDRFPKQYPEFRPPAQWSRVVGVTHSGDYRLFQLGKIASPEFKAFAETGKQELLGNAENEFLVFDEFLLAAVKNGSGKVSADFIVDSNHTKVSMASKIIPSPDWFVGVDSLDLCADGRWVDTVTMEASPLDAGTDSGFTFTAPNWATEPQEAIYKITSQYPRHAANSFFYPKLRDLPPIATFHIYKKRSYSVHKDTGLIDNLEMNDILPWKHMKKKASKKKRSRKPKKEKCEVGEWSEWSACNAPCGQSKRTRKIIKSGQICPALLEVRTCGCTKYIFNW